ncbi:hypothetical protein ACP4OV_023209 [Aristida adscensionis]
MVFEPPKYSVQAQGDGEVLAFQWLDKALYTVYAGTIWRRRRHHGVRVSVVHHSIAMPSRAEWSSSVS